MRDISTKTISTGVTSSFDILKEDTIFRVDFGAVLANRQTLGLRETVQGKEHLFTTRSKHDLSGVLVGQGKYERAEEMHRQALRLKETVLGKEHPSTLTSMRNLERTESHAR